MRDRGSQIEKSGSFSVAIFLKGSAYRLTILPKGKKIAMPEFATYLRGSMEI